jgi:hypothetical protein
MSAGRYFGFARRKVTADFGDWKMGEGVSTLDEVEAARRNQNFRFMGTWRQGAERPNVREAYATWKHGKFRRDALHFFL